MTSSLFSDMAGAKILGMLNQPVFPVIKIIVMCQVHLSFID